MPALVAWLGAAIARIFATRLGMWIATALAFLGLQLATNEVVLTPVLNQFQAAISQTGADAVGWIAFFNLDKYISCIVSAYAVAAGKSVVLRRRAA